MVWTGKVIGTEVGSVSGIFGAGVGSCFALLILPLPVVQDCLHQQNPNHGYENTED